MDAFRYLVTKSMRYNGQTRRIYAPYRQTATPRYKHHGEHRHHPVKNNINSSMIPRTESQISKWIQILYRESACMEGLEEPIHKKNRNKNFSLFCPFNEHNIGWLSQRLFDTNSFSMPVMVGILCIKKKIIMEQGCQKYAFVISNSTVHSINIIVNTFSVRA